MAGGKIFNNVCFADDICLLTTSILALKKLLVICEQFASSHDLTFNARKTVCQCFCGWEYDETRPLIRFGGNILQWQECARYLGYDMNCRDRDSDEILRRRRELYTKANLLASYFMRCSESVKRVLFKTFFSSVYCMSLWSPVRKGVLEKVRVAYNDACRIIFMIGRRESATKMFANLRLNDFTAVRRRAAYSLFNRCVNSENSIIKNIINSEIFLTSSIYKNWMQLLYNFKII